MGSAQPHLRFHGLLPGVAQYDPGRSLLAVLERAPPERLTKFTMSPFYGFILGVLGVWRMTHLLSAEDGPWEAFVRLRRFAGSSIWGEMLDCFYCLSLWVSAPFALLLASTWREALLLWLALSGGAILLERICPQGAPAFFEEPAPSRNPTGDQQ
jgi:hypothetical protein